MGAVKNERETMFL